VEGGAAFFLFSQAPAIQKSASYSCGHEPDASASRIEEGPTELVQEEAHIAIHAIA